MHSQRREGPSPWSYTSKPTSKSTQGETYGTHDGEYRQVPTNGHETNANENGYKITEPAATKGPRELQLSSIKDKSLTKTGFNCQVATSSTLETDRLRKKAAEVVTPQTLSPGRTSRNIPNGSSIRNDVSERTIRHSSTVHAADSEGTQKVTEDAESK